MDVSPRTSGFGTVKLVRKQHGYLLVNIHRADVFALGDDFSYGNYADSGSPASNKSSPLIL